MRRALILGLLLALCGCNTIHQQIVTPKVSVAQLEPVLTATGYVIDAQTRDRYNALIDVYGKSKYADGAPVFIPALRRDDGVTVIGPGKWLMTFAARQNFAVLKGMQFMAFPPK